MAKQIPFYTQVNQEFCDAFCAAWHGWCGHQYCNEDGGLCLWSMERAMESIQRYENKAVGRAKRVEFLKGG